MTDFESDKLTINCSSEKIFNFLSDFNNFGKLMPEQISNWKATEDTCSFTIQGMAELSMRISEKNPFSKIVYSSDKVNPFDYNLTILLSDTDNKTLSQVIFSAELSTMLKMMLQRPLQNFVNILNTKLKEQCEAL
jgi:hypothetical protein